MADEQVPDVFADGISVAAGPTGMTITLLLSDPPITGTPGPPKIVGRVRMTLELGEALTQFIGTAVANARLMPAPKLGLQPPPDKGGKAN